jgi:hypothetical protein
MLLPILFAAACSPTGARPIRTSPSTATLRASPPLTTAAGPTASSTVVAPPPLVLYDSVAASKGSLQLLARTYAGQPVGTLTIPYTDLGYEIAPDGSKVLDGEQIFSASGSTLGQISWTSPTLPSWADDSAHLCGVTYEPSPSRMSTLVELDQSGNARNVTTLGPITATTSWRVIACSPGADRAVLVDQGEPVETIVVIRLSTGARIAEHLVSDASWGAPIASHDGGMIAINESWGIAIRDISTWTLHARVVRWGSQAGGPLIGAALLLSWDGSRMFVDGGGASGATHPVWFVDWAHNRDVLTSGTASAPAIFNGGGGGVIPLTEDSSFFIASFGGNGATYILDHNGHLQHVEG